MPVFEAPTDGERDEGPVFRDTLPQSFAWIVGAGVAEAPVDDFLEAFLVDPVWKGREGGREGEREGRIKKSEGGI
jgi:hypothetical protein